MKNKLYTLAMVLAFLGTEMYAQNQTVKDSIRVNQYGQEVSWMTVSPEAHEGIINFISKDKTYRLWLDNRVQFDGAVFSNDVMNPIGNGVTIRRARFAVKAILWKNWYGEVDLDFANSELELKDAYIAYLFNSDDLRLGNSSLKLGHYKENFGMETTTTSRYLTFIERSLPSKLDPSRHLGIQYNKWAHKYLLSGGVHFKSVGDIEEVGISKDNNKDFGLDEGYSLTGRAVYRPYIGDQNHKVIHLGMAASYRTPKTTDELKDSYRFSTRSHSSINRKKYIDTDNITDVESTNMLNFEFVGAYKNFILQSEYKNVTVNRKADLESVNINGFYVQASCLLFGGRYNYNESEGEFTRLTTGKKYGDLELGFRYDYVDANDFGAGVFGGAAEGYTVGLNYYFNQNVKFMLNYVYNNHDRYANGKDKLYIGHDASGNLSKDPSEIVETGSSSGDDFGMLAMRMEINF